MDVLRLSCRGSRPEAPSFAFDNQPVSSRLTFSSASVLVSRGQGANVDALSGDVPSPEDGSSLGKRSTRAESDDACGVSRNEFDPLTAAAPGRLLPL